MVAVSVSEVYPDIVFVKGLQYLEMVGRFKYGITHSNGNGFLNHYSAFLLFYSLVVILLSLF